MSTEVAVPTTSPKVKKSPKAKGTKKAAVPSHPPFAAMIKKAISSLKEKGGSSQIAILKYVMANYSVGSDAKKVNTRLRLALRRGVQAGELLQPKGPAGRVKLSEKAKTVATTAAKKPKAKKAPSGTPKPAVKKVKKSPAKPKKTKSPAKAKSPKKPKAAKKPAAAKPKPKKSPKKAVKAKKAAKK